MAFCLQLGSINWVWNCGVAVACDEGPSHLPGDLLGVGLLLSSGETMWELRYSVHILTFRAMVVHFASRTVMAKCHEVGTKCYLGRRAAAPGRTWGMLRCQVRRDGLLEFACDGAQDGAQVGPGSQFRRLTWPPSALGSLCSRNGRRWTKWDRVRIRL
jgi:hypothetical protein